MIPIIRLELKQRKLYIFCWYLILALLIGLLMLIYPSIHHQAQQLDQVVNQLPTNLRELKGFNGDVASPIGYLNTQMYYATLPLLFSILTIGLGSSLLARDEQQHTLELLVARPISRTRILAAKGISGLIIALGAGIVTTAVTLVLVHPVGMTVSTGDLLLTSLMCTMLAVCFGAIAFALTAASGATRRLSVGAAASVAFGGYILTSLANSTDSLKTAAKLFPFHYYNPTDMLHGTFSAGLDLYLAGILIVTVSVAILGFRHRDLA